MKYENILNFIYQFPISKKVIGDTIYIIDEQTGVIFSESKKGIIAFQDAEGNKIIYTETPIEITTDLPHLTQPTKDGGTCMSGTIRITENKEYVFNKAYHYFSGFIIKDQPFVNVSHWNIPLNSKEKWCEHYFNFR